jgi:hypothetical protein
MREMQGRGKLSRLNRFAAMLLALVWLAAGCVAGVLGFASGHWWVVTGGFLAIVYGLLWMRVAVRSRLLSWQEFTMPWRTASHPSRSGLTSRTTRRDGSQQ